MKIAVCIASRNRPEQLSLEVSVMRTLESGHHDVEYIVGCDLDDHDTAIACENLGVKKAAAERPTVLAQVHNRLIQNNEADCYVPFPDDAIVLCQEWDEVIADSVDRSRLVFGWDDVLTEGELTYPVITAAWKRATDKVFTEHFPFWFADTWLHEVYRFATNSECRIIPDFSVGGKRGKTQNLRDLDFWWGFFNATRIIRVKEAYQIYRKINNNALRMSENDFVASRKTWLDMGEQRDRYFRPLIKDLEANLADRRDPSIKYGVVKSMAEQYLKNHFLTPWGEI